MTLFSISLKPLSQNKLYYQVSEAFFLLSYKTITLFLGKTKNHIWPLPYLFTFIPCWWIQINMLHGQNFRTRISRISYQFAALDISCLFAQCLNWTLHFLNYLRSAPDLVCVKGFLYSYTGRKICWKLGHWTKREFNWRDKIFLNRNLWIGYCLLTSGSACKKDLLPGLYRYQRLWVNLRLAIVNYGMMNNFFRCDEPHFRLLIWFHNQRLLIHKLYLIL
jgi:hypothetical protein